MSRRGRPARGAVAALVLCLVVLAAAPRLSARDFASDEVRDLRVAKAPGGVDLGWAAPLDGADDYVVRRCDLDAVAGSAGNCVAEGVADTSFVDGDETGTVYYVVTAVRRGLERTPGVGVTPSGERPRTVYDCGVVPDPTPFWVTVEVTDALDLCGSEVDVRFPETYELLGFECVGLQSGFIGTFGRREPGLVRGGCGNASPTGTVRGPGDLMRFQMQRGACFVEDDTFTVERCVIVTDCEVGGEAPAPCALRIE